MVTLRILINIVAVLLAVTVFSKGYNNDITAMEPIMLCFVLILLVPNVCSLLERLSSSKHILILTVIIFNISLLALNLLSIGYLFAFFFNFFRKFYLGVMPVSFYMVLWLIFIINYTEFVLLIMNKFKEKYNIVALKIATLYVFCIVPIFAYSNDLWILCPISFLLLFILTLKSYLPDNIAVGKKKC